MLSKNRHLLLNNAVNLVNFSRLYTLRMFAMTKMIISALALWICIGGSAALASGECYYLYKAKKNAPLQLHLGMMRINDTCSAGPHKTQLSDRLAQNGWKLMQIVKQYPEIDGVKFKNDLGEFFLKY
jgi:hypothetical protein